MKRVDAESDLDFIGFIVFENKLKTASIPVINELNDAGIREVMCTGDNLLTAISVARECHLIDRTAHCFVPHFVEGMDNSQLFYSAFADVRRLQRWCERTPSTIEVAKR